MGSSTGATPDPKAVRTSPRVRSKSACSRSSLLTTTSRGSPSAAAARHASWVWACTPSVALTTTTARSATDSAAVMSAAKSAYPGASRRLTFTPSTSKGAMAIDTDSWRDVSSGSKSHTVLPRSTDPCRGIVPVAASSASASVVFPAPWWPTRATLRILVRDRSATLAPSSARAPARRRSPSWGRDPEGPPRPPPREHTVTARGAPFAAGPLRGQALAAGPLQAAGAATHGRPAGHPAVLPARQPMGQTPGRARARWYARTRTGRAPSQVGGPRRAAGSLAGPGHDGGRPRAPAGPPAGAGGRGACMFDGRWREAVDRRTRPVGAALQRHGVTADVLTATGLLSATATAVAVASGHLHLAIVLLAVTGVHDLLDGPVAKAAGTASTRGAFFDSVTDRVADAVLMGGVAWYLVSAHRGHVAVLPLAILGVTALVSYERAKAEALGLTAARGGLMERAERMILLGVGFLTSALLVPVLWLLLALTSATAAGRFLRVWRSAEGPDPGARAEQRRYRRVAGRHAVRARRTESMWRSWREGSASRRAPGRTAESLARWRARRQEAAEREGRVLRTRRPRRRDSGEGGRATGRRLR